MAFAAPPARVALKLNSKALGVPAAPLRAAPAVHDPGPQPLDSTDPASLCPTPRLAAAFMMAERFDEALTTIESMPSASRAQPDVLLLTAMIQIERGNSTTPPGCAQRCSRSIISTPARIT